MRRTDRELRDPAEIRAVLEQADACHLALADNDTPYLVTMNFGLRRSERLHRRRATVASQILVNAQSGADYGTGYWPHDGHRDGDNSANRGSGSGILCHF